MDVLYSRLLAVRGEDTVLLSLLTGVIIYFSAESSIWNSKHEKARLEELFSVPQQKLFPAGLPSDLRERSRNICDVLNSPTSIDTVVFWASQSGTAEALASRYASEISTTLPLRAMTVNLTDYDHKHMPEIPSKSLLVFIVSTFGDGDPPDNGVALLESLIQLREKGASLKNIRYVVFGLGNSNYTHFNKFALEVDSILGEMGAARLGGLGLGDDRKGGTEEDFVNWKNESMKQVAKALQLRAAKREYSPRLKIRPLMDGNDGTKHEVLSNLYHGEPPYSSTAPDRSSTAILPIVQAKLLNSSKEGIEYSQSSRQCVHMEFSLEDHPSITYQTGDYLCIWPINPEYEVSTLLRAFGAWNTRKDVIDVVPVDDTSFSNNRIPTPTTLENLFRYYLDICGPVSRELLGGIADLTSDGDVKRQLETLTKDRDTFHEKVSSKRLTLAGVLQMVATRQDRSESILSTPLSYVLENMKKLQPRSYSISSSAAVNPRVLAITALAVNDSSDETSSHPYRFCGLASNYLLQLQQEFRGNISGSTQSTDYYYSTEGPRSLLKGEKVFAYIRRSAFKLPENPSTPIIMISSGTGVAPFRAFVQERMSLKNQGFEIGKMVLLVGHRSPDQDFYYQDLWAEAEKVLGDKFEAYTAFSRADSQPRQYVQDLLATKSDLVLDILASNQPVGGVMYICGSSLMAKGVKKSLADIWSRSTQHSAVKNAEEWLEELSHLRRLQEDSWG